MAVRGDLRRRAGLACEHAEGRRRLPRARRWVRWLTAAWRLWRTSCRRAGGICATVAAGESARRCGQLRAPTVLTGVPLDAKVFNEEPFGAVGDPRLPPRWDEAIARRTARPSGWRATRSRARWKNAHRLAHEPRSACCTEPTRDAERGDALRRHQAIRCGTEGGKGARRLPEHARGDGDERKVAAAMR